MSNAATLARCECKYRIRLDLVAEIQRSLRPFCEMDRHAKHGPDGLYSLTSLYFDNDRDNPKARGAGLNDEAAILSSLRGF
jgi:hypothetical protein